MSQPRRWTSESAAQPSFAHHALRNCKARESRVAQSRGIGTLSFVPFTISIDSTQPYLMLAAAGPATLAEVSGLAALIAQLVKLQGHDRVLANLCAVEPQLSFTDHLRVAALGLELLGRLTRLSAVVPPGYLDAPAARAAQLAGMRLHTFLRLDEAKAWLEQPAQSLRSSTREAAGAVAGRAEAVVLRRG